MKQQRIRSEMLGYSLDAINLDSFLVQAGQFLVQCLLK